MFGFIKRFISRRQRGLERAGYNWVNEQYTLNHLDLAEIEQKVLSSKNPFDKGAAKAIRELKALDAIEGNFKGY